MTSWCICSAADAALERGYDLTLVEDGQTTCSIARGNGSFVEAEGIVEELDPAMTWVDYPGRTSTAEHADEVAFAF